MQNKISILSGRSRSDVRRSLVGLIRLGVVIFTAGVIIGEAQAAVPAVNPQSGSVGLSGAVRGAPPTQPAVIVSPRSGQHVSTIPVTVSGLCTAKTFVNINRNNVFAGSTVCSDNGTFSLQADLFDGANSLVAQVTDALGQAGPDSGPVDVFYDAPSLSIPGSATFGKQLFLQTTTSVAANSPGLQLTRSATIVGGIGPYAVEWDWGDGTTSLASQRTEGPISSKHAYDRPGNYRVIVRVSDSSGNAAYLQLVTVVNGPADQMGINGGVGKGALSGALDIAWPGLGLVASMALAFWLGKRRQQSITKRQALTLAAEQDSGF